MRVYNSSVHGVRSTRDCLCLQMVPVTHKTLCHLLLNYLPYLSFFGFQSSTELARGQCIPDGGDSLQGERPQTVLPLEAHVSTIAVPGTLLPLVRKQIAVSKFSSTSEQSERGRSCEICDAV